MPRRSSNGPGGLRARQRLRAEDHYKARRAAANCSGVPQLAQLRVAVTVDMIATGTDVKPWSA